MLLSTSHSFSQYRIMMWICDRNKRQIFNLIWLWVGETAPNKLGVVRYNQVYQLSDNYHAKLHAKLCFLTHVHRLNIITGPSEQKLNILVKIDYNWFSRREMAQGCQKSEDVYPVQTSSTCFGDASNSVTHKQRRPNKAGKHLANKFAPIVSLRLATTRLWRRWHRKLRFFHEVQKNLGVLVKFFLFTVFIFFFLYIPIATSKIIHKA